MSPPLVALADDLTGAAEIAAIAARFGLCTLLVTEPPVGIHPAEAIVLDTDTRLAPPAVAAARVRAAGETPLVADAAWVYKKTDSVLRGPVRAELEALAAARHVSRVVLVPANPALQRIVQAGRYSVHGVAVSETMFARDPHHPVTSSDVITMLDAHGTMPVQSLPPGHPLPATGLVVGDAASAQDLSTWASQLDAGTLPAGGAGFFAALLQARGRTPQPAVAPSPLRGAVLVISGTKHPALAPPEFSADSDLGPRTIMLPADLLRQDDSATLDAAFVAWSTRVGLALNEGAAVCVSASAIETADPTAPEKVRTWFSRLVAGLHARRAFAHLVVEGGATAAAIVQHLGWRQLAVTHEWAQGVVSLQPVGVDGVDLTLKPGSYAWPPEFRKLRLQAQRLRSHDRAP